MKFIIRFAHNHIDFIYEELKALLSEGTIESSKENTLESPYVAVESVPDVMRRVGERSAQIKAIYKIIGVGNSLESLVEDVRMAYTEGKFSEIERKTFKYTIDCYVKKMDQEEQKKVIESFGFLPLKGEISMKNPEIIYSILHDGYMEKWYFGTRDWEGTGRKEIDRYSLKKRRYIGTTSMDAELAMIMVNMGQVSTGDIVYDPFAGTGSILIAAANAGGYILGTDIDGRQLRGKEKGGIRENFKEYGIMGKLIDLCIGDFTKLPWKKELKIDVIVTDPPYGVRAGGKKIQAKETARAGPIGNRKEEAVYPETCQYLTEEIYKDLLEYASEALKEGGRLVFWYPAAGEGKETKTPTHKRLREVGRSIQRFGKWSRILITMVKQGVVMENFQGVDGNREIGESQRSETKSFGDWYYGRESKGVNESEQ